METSSYNDWMHKKFQSKQQSCISSIGQIHFKIHIESKNKYQLQKL